MCLVLRSWADAERVGLSGYQHEDWPPCKRSLVLEYIFFHMQLKFSFSSISHLWLHYLVFSSGKPVNAAMENVRKAINRHDLFYDCVSHKVFILTIANGLFDLSLWVVLLYWASCVLPQVSDWKWPLGGAVEQAPEQSRGVGKVIFFLHCGIVTTALQFCIK